MTGRRLVRGALLLSALFVVGAYLFLERFNSFSGIQFSYRPASAELVPIGELVNGTRVEQSVDAGFEQAVAAAYADSSVCLNMLMANYGDRRNSGRFAVDLVLDGEFFTHEVEAADVHDNVNHVVCYEGLTVSRILEAHDIRLVLRGLTSAQGRAVTAWATTDTAAGRLQNVQGDNRPRSLVFHFSVPAQQTGAVTSALVLIVIGMLAIAAVLLLGKPFARSGQGV